MQDFEKKQFEEWQKEQAFEKIVHYVDLLKDPSYEHLGQKAAALNNLRRYHEAKDLLESIYEQGKEDTMWYYRYAYLQMQFYDIDTALKSLERSLELDKTNGDAWFLLSVAYSIRGDEELAKSAHEAAIANNVNLQYLNDDVYRQNQKFNPYYNFGYLNVIKDERLKKVIEEAIGQTIYLFEEKVQTFDQIPKIIHALINTIKQQLQENGVYFAEQLRMALEDDVLYLLEWFGVPVAQIMHIELMWAFESYYPYIVKMPVEHLMTLLHVENDNWEDNVNQLLQEVKHSDNLLEYYLITIDCALEQEYIDLARQLLNDSDHLKHGNDIWWQLNGYAYMAEDNPYAAKEALDLALHYNAKNVRTWMAIEHLYLEFFDDIKKANDAREQWENLINLL